MAFKSPNDTPPKDFVSSVDPKDCGAIVCVKYSQLVPEECRCEATPRPWYLDNDGDGWHSTTQEAIESPQVRLGLKQARARIAMITTIL